MTYFSAQGNQKSNFFNINHFCTQRGELLEEKIQMKLHTQFWRNFSLYLFKFTVMNYLVKMSIIWFWDFGILLWQSEVIWLTSCKFLWRFSLLKKWNWYIKVIPYQRFAKIDDPPTSLSRCWYDFSKYLAMDFIVSECEIWLSGLHFCKYFNINNTITISTCFPQNPWDLTR